MEIWEVEKRLREGAIRLYQVENSLDGTVLPEEKPGIAAGIRREFVSGSAGAKLGKIGDSYVGAKIEQSIGGAITPLGISGPLRISGRYDDEQTFSGDFYIPMATSESALIAGLSRGIKAVNKAGGVKTLVTADHMIRSPLVETPSIGRAYEIAERLGGDKKFFNEMDAIVRNKAKVSRLLKVEPLADGRDIHLQFYFFTGDAMGMNSATIYTADILKEVFFREYPDCRLITLSGNTCTDKKATAVNNLRGRGKSVAAEVFFPDQVIQEVFGTHSVTVEQLNWRKNYEGSSLAGTLGGFNGNAANVVAAMFIATGQDAAQIVESSSCRVKARAEKNGLYFAVSMPSLEVGTIGGGTGYGTAKEALALLGCYGPGKEPGDNSRKLAQIIGGAVLVQELNLLGTQAKEYQLADSHKSLSGRDTETYNIKTILSGDQA